MLDQALSPAPRSRFATPYVVAWAILASLALGYLGVLTLRPDLIALYLPGSPPAGSPDANEVQRAATDALAEVRALKSTVDRMDTDVAKLKEDVAAQASLSQGWEARIASLEARPEPQVAAAPAARQPEKGMKAISAKAGAQAKQAGGGEALAVAPAAAAAAAVAPVVVAPGGAAKTSVQQQQGQASSKSTGKQTEMKVINAPLNAEAGAEAGQTGADGSAAQSLETGSVGSGAGAEAGGVVFGPGTVSAAAKPVGIVIGNGPTVDSLRLTWSLLSERHAPNLGALQPRYTAGVDANGLTYDLVAGPVKSEAEAKKLCKDLAAKAIICRVGEYAGEAL
jgi:hypothetical protein